MKDADEVDGLDEFRGEKTLRAPHGPMESAVKLDGGHDRAQPNQVPADNQPHMPGCNRASIEALAYAQRNACQGELKQDRRCCRVVPAVENKDHGMRIRAQNKGWNEEQQKNGDRSPRDDSRQSARIF